MPQAAQIGVQKDAVSYRDGKSELEEVRGG